MLDFFCEIYFFLAFAAALVTEYHCEECSCEINQRVYSVYSRQQYQAGKKLKGRKHSMLRVF